MGVENGLTDDGAAIKQRTDANQAWQQWKLTELGNGYYRVTANHSGKTLDVSGGSIQDFAQVTQWTYAGQNNQQWAIQRDNQGYYQLITRHSGKLLDVQSSNQNEGGAVGQYTANGTQAQQWKIEQRTCVNKTPVSLDASKCYRITSRVSGKVLGIDGGTMTDGAKARQRTNANKMWQQWRIQPAEKGFFQLIAVHSSKLLTVAGASQEDFASLIQQSTGNGVTNQHWTVERNTEGYYSFTARHSGRLMDLNSSSLTDGATINQYMPNGTQAQQWRVEEATCSTNNSARLSTDADAQGEYDSETFRLWPNPAQHSVSIDLRSAQGQPTIITILDVMGRRMQQVQVDTRSEPIYKLDVAALSAGQYVVRIDVANQPSTLLRLLINR